MNKNLPRWVFISILKHFDDRKEDLLIYIEGQTPTDGFRNHMELRIDTNMCELQGYLELDVTINILLSVVVKNTENDLYLIQKLAGQVASAFTVPIEISQYGDITEDADNDESFIDCLTPKLGNDGDIITNHFGQVKADIPYIQATVERSFQMKLFN